MIVLMVYLSSCKKPAGEGGKASIKGSVWVEDYNSAFTVLNGSYNGADVEVYIIYGDETNFGERLRANYEGKFEFNYLRPGKYKVYVYSKDNTLQSESGMVTVVKEVEIKSKKEVVDLGQISIYN